MFISRCGKKSIYENSVMILIGSITLSTIAAIPALVTFIFASNDPFATEGSKPSCKEIQLNDELYYESGKEKWVTECRTEKTENLSDIFG